MSWVRPDWEILPRPNTHTSDAQLYDAVMVVVSRKLGRKCLVSTESLIRDLWCVNPLHYPPTTAASPSFYNTQLIIYLIDILGKKN